MVPPFCSCWILTLLSKHWLQLGVGTLVDVGGVKMIKLAFSGLFVNKMESFFQESHALLPIQIWELPETSAPFHDSRAARIMDFNKHEDALEIDVEHTRWCPPNYKIL